MDRGELKQTIESCIKKYRWAAAVLLAGILLMALPAGAGKHQEAPAAEPVPEQTLQQELEALLSRLEGAGRVKVLLTRAAGEEIHYQTDEDAGRTENSSDIRTETVLITAADRSDTGLVRRIDPPRYLGAVVVCQGADRASVRLAVLDAVATATGLTSDKISVLKMK